MYRWMLSAAVVALAVGGVGLASAGNGQGDQGNGGVQAWAQVNPDGPALVKAKNVVAVSSPQPGIYCLRVADGVDLTKSAPVADQEQNLSSRLGLVTVRALNGGTPNVSCPTTSLQVTTWDAANPSTPTQVGGVAFDVIIP